MNLNHIKLVTIFLFGLILPVRAQNDSSQLRIFPPAISLDHEGESQRIIVIRQFADGRTQDVSREARLVTNDPAMLRVGPGNLIVAKALGGKATLRVECSGLSASAQVRVAGDTAPPPISFINDVIPTLTRQDCNSGGCHGAASGKGGFRLSLFGFDPSRDYDRISRELRGRRLDLAKPEKSLILRKPTTQVAHKGGHRLVEGTSAYRTLHEWIRSGVDSDLNTAAELTSLKVYPSDIAMMEGGEQQSILVMANYSDGTDRDVSALAIMSSSHPSVVKVDSEGTLTSSGRGQSIVMARFGSLAEVTQVTVIPDAQAFVWSAPEASNLIDRHVQNKLKRLKTHPAPVCDDSTFVRRVYLDIIGVLPEVAEVRSFLRDPSLSKRADLVANLIERPEFANLWAMKWSEILRIDSFRLRRKGVHRFTEYLRDAFSSHRPFDEVAREILSASGGNFGTPAANYWLVERNPRAIAENVAQVFMGVRIQCAQCHDHPFDRWTMDDYYGFAAFFARVRTKASNDPRERIVYSSGGEIRHERDNRVVPPKHLGGELARLTEGQTRRAALATWLTADDNPWFANNIVNRVWQQYFGRGLTDEVDDVRVSNPPSHPELQTELARMLREKRYDIRPLVKLICASQAYQAADTPDSVQASAFASAPIRRLSAEQMLDAIGQVTGKPSSFRELPEGARATEVRDGNPRSRFLDIFGRPRRSSACACERRGEPTLTQALHLINGNTMASKVNDRQGRLRKAIANKQSDAQILEDLWLAAYARFPSSEEEARFLFEVGQTKQRLAMWQDIYWAVLNSKEFLFNH